MAFISSPTQNFADCERLYQHRCCMSSGARGLSKHYRKMLKMFRGAHVKISFESWRSVRRLLQKLKAVLLSLFPETRPCATRGIQRGDCRSLATSRLA